MADFYSAPKLLIDNDSEIGYYANIMSDGEENLDYYVALESHDIVLQPDDEGPPIVEIPVYKYTLSFTGVVYTPVVLANGIVLYRDKSLAQNVGTTTFYGNYPANKYNISGASGFSTFYVPANTTLASGTKIYSNAICTNQIGTISEKISETTTTVTAYKYEVAAWKTLWGLTAGQTFYTKKKVTSSVSNLQVYKNSACTSKGPFKVGTDGRGSSSDVKIYTYSGGEYVVTAVMGGNTNLGTNTFTSKGTISSSTTSTYYKLSGSSAKCTISNKTTVTTPIVVVNNGINETYVYNGIE